jgi:hypothetical protein
MLRILLPSSVDSTWQWYEVGGATFEAVKQTATVNQPLSNHIYTGKV